MIPLFFCFDRHNSLPEWAREEIEKIAQQKGLAFATIVQSIVVEHLRDAPATPSTMKAGAANTVKEGSA